MLPRLLVTLTLVGLAATARAQSMPFSSKVEVFRHDEEDVAAFVVRLEQPFLAGEFEQSNYLRLRSLDDRSYLVYPRETRFRQKHAEFYGRLRGKGTAKLELSYEIVSENLDGSRKVDVRSTEIEVPVPQSATGAETVYKEWARQQNAHFAHLLRYYPEDSFLEYVLLQSRNRYGVDPPPLPQPARSREQIDERLYHVMSSGMAIQEALQRQVLRSGPTVGDLTVHTSQLRPPTIESLDYADLLKEKVADGAEIAVADVTRLVPHDHYVFHVNSIGAVTDLIELSEEWGGSLFRLFTVSSRNPHLQRKYERQLCVDLAGIGGMFADGVVSEAAATGSDFNLAEGTDLTLLLRLAKPDRYRQAVDGWVADVKELRPDVEERTFNYRGHEIVARYTNDRMVSAFSVRAGEYVAVSNSHVAIRRIVDTLTGKRPSLHDAADHRYVSTILPPSDRPNGAYLYASDAFLRRLVSPAFKIAEKRRRQSFNNLVMINNASMFHRLEHGRSPASLTELVEGRFVDPDRIVCPGGGAYAWSAERDTATSSLYNRIKYLTPILELTDDEVLLVSRQEQQEYEQYRQRYEEFWRGYFDPIAIRFTTGRRTRLETCVLPLANGSTYQFLREVLDDTARPLPTANVAETAIGSLLLVPGRETVGEFLRSVPGVSVALEADPTLTDLTWLGDRVGVHVCDDDSVLEIDPARLEPMQTLVPLSVPQQLGILAAVTAMERPMYVTLDVEDERKATRLLEQLTSQIFLEGNRVGPLETNLDAYRLPDYEGHPVYVLSYQVYAAKIRLHLAVLNGQLVAATTQATLRQAIDAADAAPEEEPREGHALMRLNFRAIRESRGDFQLHWAEKARRASHRNVMPIYNLIKLYDVPIDEVNLLADAKYGVTYFCPDGEYRYDAARDEVFSTVYGNRQHARQNLGLDPDSSFAKFVDGLDAIAVTLRFRDEALLGTVDIERRATPREE